jgi:hypothetical protein
MILVLFVVGGGNNAVFASGESDSGIDSSIIQVGRVTDGQLASLCACVPLYFLHLRRVWYSSIEAMSLVARYLRLGRPRFLRCVEMLCILIQITSMILHER